MIPLTLRIDVQRLPQVDFQTSTTTADRLVTEEDRLAELIAVISLSADIYSLRSQIVGPHAHSELGSQKINIF